jgi:hypothetical protein
VPESRGGTRTVPLCGRCHALTHDSSRSTLARDGRRAKRRRGGYVGGWFPFGYHVVGSRKSSTLIPIPREQRDISRILASRHLTLAATADMLNSLHTPTRHWTRSAVRAVRRRYIR